MRVEVNANKQRSPCTETLEDAEVTARAVAVAIACAHALASAVAPPPLATCLESMASLTPLKIQVDHDLH